MVIYKLRDWIPIDKLDFYYLSSNPNAISILEKNIDQINWYNLSRNPNAIHLLEQNMDKIEWECLSENPNAIHLLENNIDKIDWSYLSLNPSIFEYNYEAMRNRMKLIAEELIANRFHPKNMDKFVSCGFEDFELE